VSKAICSSFCFRSVMSRAILEAPMILPFEFLIGETVVGYVLGMVMVASARVIAPSGRASSSRIEKWWYCPTIAEYQRLILANSASSSGSAW
jgi:hypothetical protein